jgi:AcrR family transcriptional regulator
MTVHTRPGARPAYDTYDHRYALYTKAAPVFRAFGYRQVTMKALAHACGVSAPALYRYFPSKLDFALFPLDLPPEGFCRLVMTRAAEAQTDPLHALRAGFEAALVDIDCIVLAVRLALEVGRDERSVLAKRDLDAFEADVARFTVSYVPQLGERARDLAHTIMSLVVTAAATDADLSASAFRRQAAAVVRGYLVDAGLPHERTDIVFGPTVEGSTH